MKRERVIFYRVLWKKDIRLLCKILLVPSFIRVTASICVLFSIADETSSGSWNTFPFHWKARSNVITQPLYLVIQSFTFIHLSYHFKLMCNSNFFFLIITISNYNYTKVELLKGCYRSLLLLLISIYIFFLQIITLITGFFFYFK